MKRILAPALAFALAAPAAFAQSMEITKAEDREGTIGSEDLFTGTAYIEPVFPANDPFAVNAGQVTFLPGAR